jgi:hypothetical protein
LKEEIFSCSLDEIQGKLPAPHIQVSCKWPTYLHICCRHCVV